MNSGVSEGVHLVGISALLFTLRAHGQLLHDDLLGVCSAYGLRAGAVPWEAALKRAIDMRLVVHGPDGLFLSETGNSISLLVAEDLEPSDEFLRVVLTLTLGRSSSRFTLAQTRLSGAAVHDPVGAATQVLQELAEVGLVSDAPGGWQVQDGQFAPLLIGLLLASPHGTSITQEVGKLGEQLTLRYYREQGWQPLHVASISDAFGFDVLCRAHAAPSSSDSLAVEAKGTTETTGPYRFFLSPHELRVARQLGPRYEIAVWGEIDPGASVDDNYPRLLDRRFPRRILDPYHAIGTHQPGLLTGLDLAGGSVVAHGIEWQVP
jgi:hypothetical protein